MYKQLFVPHHIIMTPGPVEADPRVLQAMTSPIIGQYDAQFLDIMDETMELGRYVFQTKNKNTFSITGTARSGIEAILGSIIEENTKVYVPIFGRFGHLMAEIAKRAKGNVHTTEKQWGTTYTFEELKQEIETFKPEVVAIVHGETSTGSLQPIEELAGYTKANNIILVVDAVATLGGVELKTDEWGIDAVATGSQKCLAVPAGLAPITYNEKVAKIILARKKIEQGLDINDHNDRYIPSNYLDLYQNQEYWNATRLNHHTESTSMIYALREGYRLLHEEGLENRIKRHTLNKKAMVAGITAMGLEIFGEPEHQMPTLTCVKVPDGVSDVVIRNELIEHFKIEIAASFGELKGKIWRIGNMGYSSRKENVLLFLGALEVILLKHKVAITQGKAVLAALDVYENQETTNT